MSSLDDQSANHDNARVRRLIVTLAALAPLLTLMQASADWPTYHGNNTRQGDDTTDAALSGGPPWTSVPLDGQLAASVSSTPHVSDLNVNAGQVLPNLAVVQLDTTDSHVGDVKVFNAAGSINVVIDIEGWFQ